MGAKALGRGEPESASTDFELARETRDVRLAELDKLSPSERSKTSAVVGGVHIETGEAAVGEKVSGKDFGKCAEDLAVEKLGGDPTKVRMSQTVRPRTGDVVPVCKRCQTKYTSSQFPPGTPMEE